jgi:hypothetical protein
MNVGLGAAMHHGFVAPEWGVFGMQRFGYSRTLTLLDTGLGV